MPRAHQAHELYYELREQAVLNGATTEGVTAANLAYISVCTLARNITEDKQLIAQLRERIARLPDDLAAAFGVEEKGFFGECLALLPERLMEIFDVAHDLESAGTA
jgi:hypothetical protein